MALPLAVTYSYSRELHERGLREFKRGKIILPLWLAGLLLWIALSLAGTWILSRALMTASPLALRAAASAAGAGLFVLILRARIRVPAPHIPVFDQTITVRFSAEGLERRVGEVESRLSWIDFLRSAEDADYLYLHAKDQSVHPVPKAAFATPEDLAELRALLNRTFPRPPTLSRSILGRTRPMFYLAFVAVLALVYIAGQRLKVPTADIGQPEFLDVKAKSLIREVRVRAEHAIILLKGDFIVDGKPYRRLRLRFPASPEELDRLLEDLPAVIDER